MDGFVQGNITIHMNGPGAALVVRIALPACRTNVQLDTSEQWSEQLHLQPAVHYVQQVTIANQARNILLKFHVHLEVIVRTGKPLPTPARPVLMGSIFSRHHSLTASLARLVRNAAQEMRVRVKLANKVTFALAVQQFTSTHVRLVPLEDSRPEREISVSANPVPLDFIVLRQLQTLFLLQSATTQRLLECRL
jgi:hypothetical protein